MFTTTKINKVLRKYTVDFYNTTNYSVYYNNVAFIKTTKGGDKVRYTEILKANIMASDLSLSQIARRLEKNGINIDKSYLSKLQNGKIPPAGERINDAIAEVLGIDKLELKVAAYREKIPKDVLEKLLIS